VKPAAARTRPPSHADSSARTTVVPTAITGRPSARAASTAAAVSAGTRNGSGYIGWLSTSSASTARLDTPACWTRGAIRTPRAASAATTRGVNGRAAEGISALPGTSEKTVW
jgi:hypothetical protein